MEKNISCKNELIKYYQILVNYNFLEEQAKEAPELGQLNGWIQELKSQIEGKKKEFEECKKNLLKEMDEAIIPLPDNKSAIKFDQDLDEKIKISTAKLLDISEKLMKLDNLQNNLFNDPYAMEIITPAEGAKLLKELDTLSNGGGKSKKRKRHTKKQLKKRKKKTRKSYNTRSKK